MSGHDTYTPSPERRHDDDPQGYPGPSMTPAPLRRAAAKMNAAAVSLVHRSTDLVIWLGLFVFLVGVGFLLLAMTDFLWHHVLGVWPHGPEEQQLRALQVEHQELQAELKGWRDAALKCRERAEDAAEEAR